MAISNFNIDLTSGDTYRGGECIEGTVVLDVWAPMEICYTEFLLHGKGTLRFFKDSSTFTERPKHEIYLDQTIKLVAPPLGCTTVTLNSGRYVSEFSYQLPENLPQSIHQFDVGNGYVFDISYHAQANVCIAMGNHYSQSVRGNCVKIIKAVKQSFTLLTDLTSIPASKDPVTYREQLLLFGSCGADPTQVTIKLDRGIYATNETIKATVAVRSPSQKHRVKRIDAKVQQRMTYCGDLIQKFKVTLLDKGEDVRRNPSKNLKTSFDLLVPESIVPSYLPHCNILDIRYDVKVTVELKGLAGKLTVRLPLMIIPNKGHTRPDNSRFLAATPAQPVFPCSPKRESGIGSIFPSVSGIYRGGYLNQPADSDGQRAESEDPLSTSAAYDPKCDNMPNGYADKGENLVTTKYKTALRCCSVCLLCCGFGIYNDDSD